MEGGDHEEGGSCTLKAKKNRTRTTLRTSDLEVVYVLGMVALPTAKVAGSCAARLNHRRMNGFHKYLGQETPWQTLELRDDLGSSRMQVQPPKQATSKQ